MTVFKYGLILLSFILLVGCNDEGHVSKESDSIVTVESIVSSETEGSELDVVAALPVKSEPLPSGYQKPGASVQFAHNYDGVSVAGEVEPVTLSFNHGYNAGIISIRLETQEGLEIADNRSPYTFALDDVQTLEIETSLSAVAEGKYYLSIFATVDGSNGNPISRVFALALNVGELGKNAKSNMEPIHMSLEETTSEEKIILMPAEEKISQ